MLKKLWGHSKCRQGLGLGLGQGSNAYSCWKDTAGITVSVVKVNNIQTLRAVEIRMVIHNRRVPNSNIEKERY